MRPVRLLPLLLVALSGCGYTLGPLVREGTRRIAVPIFQNDTRERELEYPLTLAVIRELRARGYVVSTRNRAQAVLRGRIVKVVGGVSAESPLDALEAGTVRVTLKVVLESSRGEELRSFQVSETGEFARSRGETRSHARRQALDELALTLVRNLASQRF